MADVVEKKPAAFAIYFVGSAEEGYEIQLENNEGLGEEIVASLLQDAIEAIDRTPANRAQGMW